ncbi:MAG: VTT domain-containing protein [Candidatus Bathyarchaeia archaeon]
MAYRDRLTYKVMAGLATAYLSLWLLSLLILVPHYSHETFDYTAYLQLPFMGYVSAELSEHGLEYPSFLIGLALFLPPLSILMLSSAWIILKISEATSRIRLISNLLYSLTMFMLLISFIPMVWVTREVTVTGAPILNDWLTTLFPILSAYMDEGRRSISQAVAASKAWMIRYGPRGLFAAMILGSIFSPIPNEAILAFAGMTMNPLNVGLYGGLGSTVGGVVCFYAARLGGRPLAEKFVKGEAMGKVDFWFHRYGLWTILLGRLVPFIPFDAISYLSGLARVKPWKFASLTFIGAVPRCLLYAYIGEMIAKYNLPALIVTVLLIAMLLTVIRVKEKSLRESR